MLFDTLMALWNVSIKSRETKVLVSFFLLYLGISGLPAFMSLSAFSRPIAVSHVDSPGGGKHPLHVMPSSATQNIAAMQAHCTVTPTASSAIATPTVNAGAVVSTKSQLQVGNQANIIGAGALFHQVNPPSLPHNLPSASPIVVVVPTRVPEVPTPIRSVKAVPTLVPEPKVTAATTPTPFPMPTNVVPVDTTPIIPPTPVAGQNIISGGHG